LFLEIALIEEKEDTVSVKPLLLGRKKKGKAYLYRTKIRNDHGVGLVRMAKQLLLDLGLKLGSEVVVEKRSVNPMQWEIVIKPASKKVVEHGKEARATD